MIPVTNVPNPELLIQRAVQESAQILPQTTKEGTTGVFGFGAERGSILPPRGTRQRELQLKALYFWDEMNLIRGAFTNIAKIIASVGWEITGGDTDEDTSVASLARVQGWRLHRNTGVEYFQEVMRQANFGAGWGSLITQVVLDYLRYDAGAYIEVIGQGQGFRPLQGPVMGLAHLDPLHCYPTGDPIYPCVYYDRYGGMHILHHTRVIRLVDADDGDDRRPGYGDSALSRSASIAMQELWMSRYITARLDDQPSPGLTVIGGIMKAEWDKTDSQYLNQQGTDASVWGRRKFYFTPDPDIMPKVENVEFQGNPENFSYRDYTDIDVDRLANAIGVDRQEIMQLMGGNIGSGAQSLVLNQKSKGKTIGFLFQQLERKLNDLLPPEFTFEFKARDTQESLEDAQIGQTWAAAVASMGSALSSEEQSTQLADNIEAVRDAIANTPEANDVFQQAVIAADDTPGSAPVAPTASPHVNINDNVDDVIGAKAITQKDYITTQAMFVQEVANLLTSAARPAPYIRLDRRGFGIAMRSVLKRYGEEAYKDGLRQGGVTVDMLDPDDKAAYMRTFMGQAGYIGGLADDVYTAKTITAENAQSRAILWGKSLQAFNDEGLYSADKNGMFVWRRGLTSDSCATCVRMDGQVHRLKTFKKRGIMPKSSTLRCKGFRCLCSLERTTEKARGRF
jgi:hypothetical protein